MRLLFPQIDSEIEFSENTIQILVIEKKELLSEILMNLWHQYNGELGDIILSEKEKELPLNKNTNIVYNPFELDCNEKKIINGLYKELESIANDTFSKELLDVNGQNIDFIEKICSNSTYSLDYNSGIGIIDLLKIYNVRFQVDGETLLEKIIEYIRTYHKVCGVTLFIFVNLKMFLSDSEIQDLYEFIFYEKVFLLDIEGHYFAKKENESYTIIDADQCKIILD